MAFRILCAGAAGLIGMVASGPAAANTVTFTGAVANLCVLTLTTPGALGILAGGTTLASDDTGAGGINAILTVAATGTNPSLQFGAPTMSGPASAAAATKQIGYTSAGGANQPYTAGTSTYAMTRLIDTLTVKGRATNPDGFMTGTYSLAATVTCQQ